MKKYSIDIGILENCFDFCALCVQAENETEAVEKFFEGLIEEIKELNYSKVAEKQKHWICEE